MKVKIIKPCIDGLTHEVLRAGDILEMSQDRINHAPIGYIEILEEPKERRTAEDKKATTRRTRAKQ